MIEVVDNNWIKLFLEELPKTKSLYLISPFITKNIVDYILIEGRPKIKLITRFNLNDFFSNASSLSALKLLVENGVEVKGILNLHSKVYLFDKRCAVICSANLTAGGFFRNYEFGLKIIEDSCIAKSFDYFNTLWNFSDEILTTEKIDEWQNILKISNKNTDNIIFPDFGNPDPKRQYFIKLFGKSEDRVDLNFVVRDQIKNSHCHWALSFSKPNPKRYNDGDVVYMARMVKPNDYAIFGRAIAIRHNRQRDEASASDIDQISWKKQYRYYIRVLNPEFIDKTFENCPKMNDLIDKFQVNSFLSTQKKYANGKRVTNVKRTLCQAPDVRLPACAAEWLEKKFNESMSENGAIPQEYFIELYAGRPSLPELLGNVYK